MSILNKYKHWKTQIRLNLSEYWDFVISKDTTPAKHYDNSFTKDCLAAYIDIGNKDCLIGNNLKSLSDYVWENRAINDGIELSDIGLTGVDNGRIWAKKSQVTNAQLYNILTNSKLSIDKDDYSLYLNKVDGNAEIYSYPMEYSKEGYYALKGGFFQGFYKLHGFNYEVLPQYIENEWNLEFVLRPRDYEESPNTMNAANPNNKGIFFYIGTRAENKFAQFYNADLSKYPERDMSKYPQPCDDYMGVNYFKDIPVEKEEQEKKRMKEISSMLWHFFYAPYRFDCSCAPKKENPKEIDYPDYPIIDDWCDTYLAKDEESQGYFEKEKNISEKIIETSDGSIATNNSSDIWEVETDNKFLTFDRTKNGFTVDTYDEDAVVIFQGKKHNPATNLFLLMNRTKEGYTVDTIEKYYESDEGSTKYEIDADIKNNCFALRIDDSGRIGFRYMIKDCNSENGYSIIEEYSNEQIVKKDEWNIINVKFIILNGSIDKCGKPLGSRKMKILFYVNGYLKHISQELPEFDFRELNENSLKQEGVPFNISLGGGSQGLAETIWLNYMKIFPYILPIEQNFAGTFIGDIKSFKFYTCHKDFSAIKHNYLYEKRQLNNIYNK